MKLSSPITRRMESCHGMRYRSNFRSYGFTLIEVVVATAVVGLVAGLLLSTLLSAKYSGQMSRERIIANNLINAQTEMVRTWSNSTMQTFVNGGGGSSNIVETVPPPVVTDTAFQSAFISRTTTITTNANSYQITVQIQWRQYVAGRQRTVTETGVTLHYPTQ